MPEIFSQEAVSALQERIRDDRFVADLDGDRPKRAMTTHEEYVWKKGSSKFNYIAGYFSNSAIVLWLVSRAFKGGQPQMGVWAFLGLAFFGLFAWTLMEYWFHRIPYHKGSHALVTGHLIHHESPKALLGVPYYVTAATYVPLYYGFAFFLNPAKLGVFMAFLWLGYIGYCAIHHATHHWSFKNPLFKKMKAHHLTHHYHPDRNFSITLPVWDRLFRTRFTG